MIEFARAESAKRARHLAHPLLCLEAIQAGIMRGGREGLKQVRGGAGFCVKTPATRLLALYSYLLWRCSDTPAFCCASGLASNCCVYREERSGLPQVRGCSGCRRYRFATPTARCCTLLQQLHACNASTRFCTSSPSCFDLLNAGGRQLCHCRCAVHAQGAGAHFLRQPHISSRFFGHDLNDQIRSSFTLQEGASFAAAAALDTHKALVHIFFASRATRKIRGVTDAGLKPRPLQKLAVIGGGLMGSGIATASTLAGMDVVLKEVNQQFLEVRGGREGSFRLLHGLELHAVLLFKFVLICLSRWSQRRPV